MKSFGSNQRFWYDIDIGLALMTLNNRGFFAFFSEGIFWKYSNSIMLFIEVSNFLSFFAKDLGYISGLSKSYIILCRCFCIECSDKTSKP